jgi:hypothetical protein
MNTTVKGGGVFLPWEKIRQGLLFALSLAFVLLAKPGFSQVSIEAGDPPNNTDIPNFFKSKLSDVDAELNNITKGNVKAIAISPGGRPVYAVFYGEKENFHSQADYNSAVAAQNPKYFAQKGRGTKPVIFFLGPVHGQEVEGIVGIVNLLHIAETGKDYRGREWSELKNKLEQCRVIIVPCANPDGRKRCPYNSFVGLPTPIMTKYGQGTHKDGTSWGWPLAKSLHPMKGDVGILGAYFNDDGINVMHDDFFDPMAKETKAIIDLAKSEVPDMTVSLHSHENPPRILQAAYESWFMKERIDTLIRQVNQRYKNAGLAYTNESWLSGPSVEDKQFPPKTSFNLISALHHVSGTMAFTFECPHGTLRKGDKTPIVSYEDILDIQLNLYDEMLDYLLENRLYWE